MRKWADFTQLFWIGGFPPLKLPLDMLLQNMSHFSGFFICRYNKLIVIIYFWISLFHCVQQHDSISSRSTCPIVIGFTARVVLYCALSVTRKLVCFTDSFSLSFLPQLRQACFQPQNISYPQLLSPERKGLERRGSRIGGGFSFLMVRWVDIVFWFLELHWFQKGTIEVDY